jgi:hypothetical protein
MSFCGPFFLEKNSKIIDHLLKVAVKYASIVVMKMCYMFKETKNRDCLKSQFMSKYVILFDIFCKISNNTFLLSKKISEASFMFHVFQDVALVFH